MKKSLLYPVVAAAFVLTACSNEPETPVVTDTAPVVDPAVAPVAPATDPMAAPATGGGDIVAGAMASPDHTTLVKAVQAAGLVETLQGPGPYTVFAPTNAAFDKLPAGTVDDLLKPENKDKLSGVLTYHVVPGSVDAAALTQQIQAGGGKAMLTTVNGAQLTAQAANGGVTLTDAQGNTATVTATDMRQSNGVIHVVDTVLMP